MKITYMKSVALAIGVSSLVLAGCNKSIDEFGDINQNPGATTQPIPSALLTNVLSSMGSFAWGGATNVPGGLYCQYMSETQYTDASRYSTLTTTWDGFYAGNMYDLQNIINFNTDPATVEKAAQYGSNANQIAIARILLDYHYMTLTDAWGDLPYTQALQGESAIPFDNQSDVYPAIINDLKEAIAQFDNGPKVQGDIMYGGNVDKWKKFANSIRAIMALRMSKVNASLGQTEFAAAISAGVIESNADNAGLVYPGGVYRNPIYTYYAITQRFDYAISETMTDMLTSLNDPRIDVFGSSPKGFPYGLTRADAIAWSTANPDYGNLYAFTSTPQEYPMYVLTAGQLFLARAEAAKLGWTGENAATMYANGITASMNRWGITDGAAIAAYIAQPTVALNGTDDMERIATQRWLAHYPDGNEGWAEWRRTGYPALTPAPGAGNAIPRRIPYGSTDQLYNPTNYADAASRYNVGGVANSQDGRVWWDKP